MNGKVKWATVVGSIVQLATSCDPESRASADAYLREMAAKADAWEAHVEKVVEIARRTP
jgi:hypothetical protein